MSIKKLAEHLGISKSTVSRALNGYTDVSAETRAKVMQGAKDINYRANATAKRLASGKSRHIGIILPSNEDMFISPAFSKVLASASCLLAKHDYLLIVTTIAPFQNELKVYQDFMNGGLVDGLFVVRTRKDDERIQMLNQRKFPYICHGYLPGFTSEMFVDVDNEQAFYELTIKQILAGHQKIAFLDGPNDLALSQSRLEGYKRAMNEHNLSINPQWIQNGRLSEEDAANMAKEVLSLAKRPTAILCADDIMAVGAIAASEALGFNAGSDLAIAGYGDYSVGRYSKPPITSMRYDTEKVGEEMAKLMLNRLESTAFEVQNWYKASVVERQSDQVTSPILTN